MPTPQDAPYKQEQREAKASKKRHVVLWTSTIQGTYRKPVTNDPKGKAAVKAAKRATKVSKHYWHNREFKKYLKRTEITI